MIYLVQIALFGANLDSSDILYVPEQAEGRTVDARSDIFPSGRFIQNGHRAASIQGRHKNVNNVGHS
jgi:hypothetical protein